MRAAAVALGLLVAMHMAAAEPASALFTKGTGEVDQSLASVSRQQADGGMRTVASWRPQGNPERDLAALERLYQRVLQADPVGWFEFQSIAGSQADVLKAIAEQRQRVTRELAARGSQLRPIPWSVVSMELLATADKRVSLRVHRNPAPLAGAPLTISRPPDEICTATADAQGVASCELVDAHGDGHGEEHHGPLVVTFPGALAPDRIDLPTTLVVR